MARNIVVSPIACLPVEQRAVEICEHKGIGHPDTIADSVCEAASRALSLAYLQAYGHILHHNVDKGLLVAGQSQPRFGGGRIEQPARLIICGRASRPSAAFNLHELVESAAKACLAENLHGAAADFQIETQIHAGSANLQQVFARAGQGALANDTSFGVGFAPFSRLEQAVLKLAGVLRSAEFRQRFPCAGSDFKIMGKRLGQQYVFTLALAFIDRHVADVAGYFRLKGEIANDLARTLEPGATVQINTLDDPAAVDESGLYLTVSGLSAEMGDDGQVGRGNRACGLITPARPMSLEAVAGKNPVSHVGKLYNVLAMLMARDIHAQLADVDAVTVQILSAIGQPVDQPQIAAIEIQSGAGVPEGLRREVTRIADAWLDNMAGVTGRILQGEVTLY